MLWDSSRGGKKDKTNETLNIFPVYFPRSEILSEPVGECVVLTLLAHEADSFCCPRYPLLLLCRIRVLLLFDTSWFPGLAWYLKTGIEKERKSEPAA